MGKYDRDEIGERSWVRGIQPRRWKAFMQFFRVEGPWCVNQYHFFFAYTNPADPFEDPFSIPGLNGSLIAVLGRAEESGAGL